MRHCPYHSLSDHLRTYARFWWCIHGKKGSPMWYWPWDRRAPWRCVWRTWSSHRQDYGSHRQDYA